MSDPMERGQLEIATPARRHTSNSAVSTYNSLAAANRPWPGSAMPENSTPPPPDPPSRPWDVLKRLNRTGHNGWLVTTLVMILVVTMSLSFGFAKGWLDAKTTLTASVVFLVLLFGAMLIAHWPFRLPH